MILLSYFTTPFFQYLFLFAIFLLVGRRLHILLKPYYHKIWKKGNEEFEGLPISRRRYLMENVVPDTTRYTSYKPYLQRLLPQLVILGSILTLLIGGAISLFSSQQVSLLENFSRTGVFVFGFFITPILLQGGIYFWGYFNYPDIKYLIYGDHYSYFRSKKEQAILNYQKAISIFPSEYAYYKIAELKHPDLLVEKEYKKLEELYTKAIETKENPSYKSFERRCVIRRDYLFYFEGAIEDAKKTVAFQKKQTNDSKDRYGRTMSETYFARATASLIDRKSSFEIDYNTKYYNHWGMARLSENRGDLRYYQGEWERAIQDYKAAVLAGRYSRFLNKNGGFISRILRKVKRILFSSKAPEDGISFLDELLHSNNIYQKEIIEKERQWYTRFINEADKRSERITSLERKLPDAKDEILKTEIYSELGALKYSHWDLDGSLDNFFHVWSYYYDTLNSKKGEREYYTEYLLETHPLFWEALEYIGKIKFHKRDFNEAIDAFEELNLYFRDKYTYCLYVEAKIIVKDFEGAFKHFWRAKNYLNRGELEQIKTAIKIQNSIKDS